MKEKLESRQKYGCRYGKDGTDGVSYRWTKAEHEKFLEGTLNFWNQELSNIYRNKNLWVQMEATKRIYWYSIWAIGEDSWLEIPEFDWPHQKAGLRLAYVQNRNK